MNTESPLYEHAVLYENRLYGKSLKHQVVGVNSQTSIYAVEEAQAYKPIKSTNSTPGFKVIAI